MEEVKELGKGGFGIVWLVRDIENKREIAVKYFETGEEFDSARIAREVEVMLSLHHPCILRIIGWGLPTTECRKARIATEYMKNGSISDVLSLVKNGETPSYWSHTNITIVIVGIVLGIQYLHSKNFIHRDLKPSNIFIDSECRIRIGDFGTTRMEDCGSSTTSTLGTTPYVAPEVLDRAAPTKKVDVFAFGLTVYEILKGEGVFPKDITPMQLCRLYSKGFRPEIPPTIHRSVKKLIERCWNDDPDKRPSFDEIYEKLAANWFPFYKDTDMAAVERFIAEVKAQES
jgi:serine/threonine protein kinase